jgi:DNA-directed RNA polymerase specialized sigma24 family protein
MQIRRLSTLRETHSEPGAIDQEQFDQLLQWLDPDRESAGNKYEGIRKRLIKLFVCKGSTNPEELSDRTINRVARKIPEILPNYIGDPVNYFCGVANNIFRESFREVKSSVVLPPDPVAFHNEEEELDLICLEKCMDKLPQAHRDLLIGYYSQEKKAKIDCRRELAEARGVGLNALRIRACRIRADLQKCVEGCRREGHMK